MIASSAEQIASMRLVTHLYERGISNHKVLDVMRTVPRNMFIDISLRHRAYEDVVLPIGFGQTASQPYMVAKMSELLCTAQSLDKVLEIGTGCGYQTAVLSHLAGEVFSVEVIKDLHLKAKQNLAKFNFTNINCFLGDGSQGLEAHAPFNAILVAAVANFAPTKLIAQLAPGGSLVIPLVKEDNRQYLYLIRKTASEEIMFTQIEEVQFVPLVNR